jgi:hypothetical protein
MSSITPPGMSPGLSTYFLPNEEEDIPYTDPNGDFPEEIQDEEIEEMREIDLLYTQNQHNDSPPSVEDEDENTQTYNDEEEAVDMDEMPTELDLSSVDDNDTDLGSLEDACANNDEGAIIEKLRNGMTVDEESPYLDMLLVLACKNKLDSAIQQKPLLITIWMREETW